MQKIYAKAPKKSDITSEMVIKEFKKRYPKEKDIEDVFGPDSDYDEVRKVLFIAQYNKLSIISNSVFLIAYNGLLQ